MKTALIPILDPHTSTFLVEGSIAERHDSFLDDLEYSEMCVMWYDLMACFVVVVCSETDECTCEFKILHILSGRNRTRAYL